MTKLKHAIASLEAPGPFTNPKVRLDDSFQLVLSFATEFRLPQAAFEEASQEVLELRKEIEEKGLSGYLKQALWDAERAWDQAVRDMAQEPRFRRSLRKRIKKGK